MNGLVMFGLPMCTTLGLVTMNCFILSAIKHITTQPMNSLGDLRTQLLNCFTGIGKFSAGKSSLSKMSPLLHETHPDAHPYHYTSKSKLNSTT